MIFNILALIAGISAKFPELDSYHASCQLTIITQMDCKEAYGKILSSVNDLSGGEHYGGFMNLKLTADNRSIWAVRTSNVNDAVDDVQFRINLDVTTDPHYPECEIDVRSRSRALSYWDKQSNFCNLTNTLRNTSIMYTVPDWSGCKWHPTVKVPNACENY